MTEKNILQEFEAQEALIKRLTNEMTEIESKFGRTSNYSKKKQEIEDIKAKIYTPENLNKVLAEAKKQQKQQNDKIAKLDSQFKAKKKEYDELLAKENVYARKFNEGNRDSEFLKEYKEFRNGLTKRKFELRQAYTELSNAHGKAVIEKTSSQIDHKVQRIQNKLNEVKRNHAIKDKLNNKGQDKNKTEPKEDTKTKAKNDAEKGKKAKEAIREKKITTRPRPIPQAVIDEARAQGGHVIYMEDSKGNRMHLIRVGKKTVSVMTEQKGQEPSAPLSAQLPEVKNIINQVRAEVDKPNSDISGMISKLEEMQKIPMTMDVIKPIALEEVKLPEAKIPENLDISITPTASVVPHRKKSGKFSKRKHDIQIMDAEGKIYTLTKKDVKKRTSERYGGNEVENGLNVSTRSSITDRNWESYIKQAEEGTLDIAKINKMYFNGEMKLGDNKAKGNENLVDSNISAQTLLMHNQGRDMG